MHILICHIIHEAAKGYTKPLERTIQKGKNSLIEWESIGMCLPCALAQNENHYLCNAVTLWLNRLFGLSQKKPIGITNGLCGAYEIRTRDLLRDRQAF